ncbi:hypothetical protein BC936DRAFT_148051 [Jimgerdemannia flammicorona]|uniref:Uncharacterized protein n=1 Tax=Jimgerdemannia flammicorona TaxID=994334 RepID=A0A433D3Z0_9FUNG|nr:hypothetical protein BC936DRAFT_148051 [Jimgerdemannia flammicorona]
MNNRLNPLLFAVTLGVVSGIYIWLPLLEEYKRDTNGTMVWPNDRKSGIVTVSSPARAKDISPSPSAPSTVPAETTGPK